MNNKQVAVANSIIHCEGAFNKVITKILQLKLIPCLHIENAQCLIVSTNEERTKLVSKHYNKVDLILTLNEFLESTN